MRPKSPLILVFVYLFLLIIFQINGALSQTFTGTGGLMIPPMAPSQTQGITESTVNVFGIGVLGGCKTIENVTLDIEHTFTGDLGLILIAPNGTFIELSTGNGFGGNDYQNTVFSDNAIINITSGSPPYNGSFRPEGRQNTSINNPYSNANSPGSFTFANTFTGINADGVWTLYINDYLGVDIGILNSWSITFSNNGTNFTVDTGPDMGVCVGSDVTINASNTAPNPISYQWSNGGSGPSITIPSIVNPLTLTVTVTDQSGCTATDSKIINITAPPVANPLTMQQCLSALPDQATFNLNSVNSAVGNGFTVSWFNDIGLTSPVPNTAAFISSSTIIYAVVSNGSCSSAPVPITLEVLPPSPASFDMEWIDTQICQPDMVGVNFTLPTAGTYTYEYSLICSNGTENNTITTSNNPVLFNVTGNCTLNITQITQVSTGCITVFSPPLSDDIMLENAPEIMVNPIEICSGQNINLADFVTTDAGAVLTFHNATPPLPSNQLGSTIVNPISATTYYVLSTGPNCNAQATVEVIVSSSNTPFSTDITLCENSLAIPLNPYVNPPNLIGEWSGPGVSGSSFDPVGFSGNVVLTFNPENDCYLDGTLTIELNPQQIPDLSATEICSSSGPFDLVTLQDPGFPNGIWSGDGVTGNIFSPGALTGIIDVTFTPSGQCNSPATTTIEVFPIPNLNITQNNSVCAGETVNLNDYVINPSGHSITFYSALPASSANEILNPNINISDPSTFFIKATDIHGCFDIQPLTINIIPGINPVSGNIEVCENNGNIDLNQLLSPGNLTGIWIGSGVSGSNFNPIGLQGNFTITFDPDDVCFLMGSVNVEVTPLQTPTLQSTTLCAGSDPIDLSVLLDPDFPNGSWFGPGVNGNTFDPSLLNGTINLTFTPNEECSASGNTTIEIFNIPYVEITENIVVCAGESVDLNAYIVNTSGLEIHFYSSLPAIPVNELSNTVMTISNTTEFYITATDLNGCTATIPFTVNSAQGESPISDNISICELEANVDLTALLNPPGLPGIWSGPGVNGNNFSPFGLQGNVLLHFDPDNLCYADGNLNIDITPPEILSLGTAEICNGSNPYNLDVLLDPAFFDGTWSGFGVEGYYFNPSSLSGTVLLTFTPDEGCVGPGTTTITIQPEPFAEIINDITVCEGTEINLSDYVLNAFSHVISFHSSIPADLSNEISNTNIVVANTVQYYVKATNQYGCIFVQPMNIFAISGGTPDLGFDVVCKNEGIYNLNLLNDPVAGTGTWSGDGVLNNELQLNLLSGIVSVNFTPDNLCYEAATTYIEIRNPIPLNLGTANLCSTAGSFDLSTIRDPFFPDGSWSGLGVSNGFFNPDSLSGVVNLTFVPSAYCANNGLTVINVTKSQTPVLKQISICESIDTFHLINLADPLFTNGIWSGSGVVDSFFITNGLHGTNSIAFTPTQNCVFPASTTIEIIPYKTPVLQPLILCETSDPIDLLTLQDTLFVTGSWSGIGVQNNYFDPKGLSDKITATFISDVECTLSASTTITVNGSPKTADLKVVCDPTGRFYDVSFEMSGGDTSSYLVNGLSTGKQYISDTITSGLPYYFVVTDNNQCEPTILQGNKNCECTTGAGTMDFTNTPLKVCKSGVVYATHFGDQTLDPNDAFSFILHDQPGLQVGNILAVSQTPQFHFPSNGILDKTYYISAIAGDTLSDGSVKQNDGCFSMAAGVPVVFYEPEAIIDQIDDVCAENCTDIHINFKGIPPFRIEFDIINDQTLVSRDTIISFSTAYNYRFCPSSFNLDSGNTTFKITRYTDLQCSPESLDSLTVFNIGKKRTSEIKRQLCKGEIVIINGTEYNESKPTGTEIINSASTGQCDSIIRIDLSYFPLSTLTINKPICENQSVIVNGTTYNKNKLAGLETIKNGNIYGCDSIITVQLTLVNEITTSLNQTLCRGESVIVNGQVYDENRPSGSELFLGNGSDKCDSTVNISLTFNEIKFLNINEILCADQSMIINGKTYDITHTEGTEVIKNGALNGCDSIINIKLSFYPIQTDTIVKVLKKGESIEINGILFNENNPKGITEDPVLTANGCQKFDYIIVYFEQDYITAKIETTPQSCPGENDGKIYISDLSGCADYKLRINGTVYPDPTFPFELDNLSPGSYQIEITGKTDCLMAKTVKILPSLSTGFTVSPIDFKMQFGQDVELHPEIIPAPSLVLWAPSQYLSCADCTTPMTRDISGDISFMLTLTDIAGCSFLYNIQLLLNKKDIEITFPNIFSPNGDGFNDFYEVKSTTSQQISRLTIFDRWGSQLFNKNREPDQESIIWDGKSHDKTIQPGVYIYLAEVTDKSGNRKYVSGDLTISF